MESAVSSAVGSRADGTRTPRRTGAMAPAPRSPRADGGPQPSLWFRHAGAGVLLCLLLVSGTVRTDGAGGPCLGGAQLCHLVAGARPRGSPEWLDSRLWGLIRAQHLPPSLAQRDLPDRAQQGPGRQWPVRWGVSQHAEGGEGTSQETACRVLTLGQGLDGWAARWQLLL